MVKQWAIFSGLAILTANASAQAFEGKVKYGKAEEPAIVMVYDYPEEIVENAFVAKFADKQYSSSKSKGFITYENATMTEVTKSKLDYYFKFEEDGRRGSKKTTVYMIMQGAGISDNPASLLNKSKSFLEKMTANVKRSGDIVEIKRQEGILVGEENSLADLEEIQKELEEKLAANKSKQEAQQKIIASQKMILDDLKAKL
ncbi:hypothetical protein [Niabella ginsengisoli]|uniref:DUF4468 domain-containing protein n=1 Tax=Niabella ginsengisoli TaxID=522298 RepID=A0ABS9SP44_9BACT|nr:hypothetical protein [Niabella ginsengisoli]MCH5600149.1 hypothetical protein [Niabella ginsengisoli]